MQPAPPPIQGPAATRVRRASSAQPLDATGLPTRPLNHGGRPAWTAHLGSPHSADFIPVSDHCNVTLVTPVLYFRVAMYFRVAPASCRLSRGILPSHALPTLGNARNEPQAPLAPAKTSCIRARLQARRKDRKSKRL